MHQALWSDLSITCTANLTDFGIYDYLVLIHQYIVLGDNEVSGEVR